jgi:CRISPR-associated protein Cmr5
MPDSHLKTLEQGRAKIAYDCAKEGSKIKFQDNEEKINDKAIKAYKSYTKQIPMMIKTNGLGAALAFVKAKSKKEYAYHLIYQQITDWLKKEPIFITNEQWQNGSDDLVNVVISLNAREYSVVTGEVLAFLAWLKRFAEGLIEGESDE